MAARYNVGADFGDDPHHKTSSPYWIIAVIRQGMPLSFSRKTMSSVTKDVTMGGYLRADTPLVITGDCPHMNISNSKRSCSKVMNAMLKQTDINYLTEVLPGDWVLAWIVNGQDKFEELLARVQKSEACNNFDDGLKFVGRVYSIRKKTRVVDDKGTKISGYSLQCISFQELETIFYYDQALASNDMLKQEFGQWMARISLRINEIFRKDAKGVPENNINLISRTFLDLVVGKGPPKDHQPGVKAADGSTLHASPQIENEAPFAYLVPIMVGDLLGKGPSDRSRATNVTAYADILELLQGIQKYDNAANNDYKIFIPSLSSESTPTRHLTTSPMLGTFLPVPPVLANRPLWSVFQQYLNPAINELYTCLRVNPDGKIAPTIVFRQIPFTTNAFNSDYHNEKDTDKSPLNVTRFMEVPRWFVPGSLIEDADVGRSDATRTNLIHVYGQCSYLTNSNVPIQYQMLNSPPIRDDLDIQRSGVRPYATTVDSWVSNSVGAVPGKWMSLIADWMIGSQYTLNGTLVTKGIYSPICEGDNVEFDGCVYHIESVNHTVSCDGEGNKFFSTSLSLTNGMRAVDGETTDVGGDAQPIYPGFRANDNRGYDPGLSLQGERPQELADPNGTTPRQKEMRDQEKRELRLAQVIAEEDEIIGNMKGI